uniref:LRRNT domain-containing protein n=1 Tax=Panagrellus redivivus TaxID=6233 RepID=A0A7E4W013_PANRE
MKVVLDRIPTLEDRFGTGASRTNDRNGTGKLPMEVTINAACPVNCTCSSYDVVCIGADFNEVIASINDLMVEKVIIRETVIRHLKKLPALYVISIELSNCLIETIEEYAFDDIPLLFEINLDYNLLTEIPKLRKRNAFSKISAKGNMV